MISFDDLEICGLLDTGAAKMFVSRELIRQVPDHQVVLHAAVDMLQIWLPNSDDVQCKCKVTLKSNI